MSDGLHIKLELHPWQTPNFVTIKMPPRPRQEGVKEPTTIPLVELDAAVIAEMCDTFRREVFAKAGKDDPDRRSK